MKNIFSGNKMRILLHLLAWTILLGLPLYFINRWNIGRDFIWLYYINAVINGIIFYVNYLVIVPWLFFRDNRYRYYLSVILLIGCFYFVSDYSNGYVFRHESNDRRTEQTGQQGEQVEQNRREHSDQNGKVQNPPAAGERRFGRPPFRQMHLFNYTFTSIFLVFFSLGLRILERHATIEKKQKELEKEKLNSELAFLKSQVSPHFFFNTLNNIYSLITIHAEDAKDAVLKLSKLMRYLLYESEQGQTLLSSEIDFMNNYIDLMRLRMSEKVKLTVDFPEKYDNVTIAPLLFIPFIENAFKHGISYREKSFIDIAMTISKETLTFRCVNSDNRVSDEAVDNHSGIGLENVNKRLNLLFPGRYSLKIDKSMKTYHVELTIHLDKT
jgi:two-component sensor histidine kinase